MPSKAATASVGDVLSQRALNRALLARQLLLERVKQPALDTIHRMVGMQAQVPKAPYVGLWSRLTDFRPDELSALIADRSVVRIALMRSTIHLVTADDCLMLRPLVQPVITRANEGNWAKQLTGVDVSALVERARALVEEGPLTFKALGAALAEVWPGNDPAALAQMARTALPLVQVPPRGIWGASGQALHATAESWLGAPLARDPSPEEMVLRYLAAYGPASVQDVQTWCGLTRLGEVVERVASRLRRLRDENGRELYDLPDAPRPDPETPAPARLLPEYDNLLLSHADRTRVICQDHRKRYMTTNGANGGSFLIDGFFRGGWRMVLTRGSATVRVEPFERLSKAELASLEAEAERLLAFAAADAQVQDIQFVTAAR